MFSAKLFHFRLSFPSTPLCARGGLPDEHIETFFLLALHYLVMLTVICQDL
jgi:hypothetical protein